MRGPKRLLLLSELYYMLWCVIYGPKRLLLLSELFYMLWCVIYGPPCIIGIIKAGQSVTLAQVPQVAHFRNYATCIALSRIFTFVAQIDLCFFLLALYLR